MNIILFVRLFQCLWFYSLNLMAPAATNNNHRAISLPNHFKWDTIETNAVLALQLNELNKTVKHTV